MARAKEFDLVIFGATGYTGALVAEHLAEHLAAHPSTDHALRWALAGRSLDRLEVTRRRIGAAESVGLLVADVADPATLRDMAARSRLVISTVGPTSTMVRAWSLPVRRRAPTTSTCVASRTGCAR